MISETFDTIKDILEKSQSEIEGEIQHNREVMAEQEKAVVKARRTNTTKAKNLKEKEAQLNKSMEELKLGLKKVRSEAEYIADRAEMDKDISSVAAARKDLTERENVARVSLEEVEAREVKLARKRKTYKEEIEKQLLAKFLK